MRDLPPTRDRVLIFAPEPLRSVLADLVRRSGYEPRVMNTPLQAIEELLGAGDRVVHAVISEELPDAQGMHELIGDEFPEVSRVYVAAPPITLAA
ncbi:MAG TPA: hypothetical protein VLB44_10120 [Kofleriaceae bacterium]|nr:hypothetical protein [Kofleriaceae bacterium]